MIRKYAVIISDIATHYASTRAEPTLLPDGFEERAKVLNPKNWLLGCREVSTLGRHREVHDRITGRCSGASRFDVRIERSSALIELRVEVAAAGRHGDLG